MKLLTKEQQESNENAKSFAFVKNNSKTNISNITNIVRLEITVIIQGNVEVLCIAYII